MVNPKEDGACNITFLYFPIYKMAYTCMLATTDFTKMILIIEGLNNNMKKFGKTLLPLETRNRSLLSEFIERYSLCRVAWTCVRRVKALACDVFKFRVWNRRQQWLLWTPTFSQQLALQFRNPLLNKSTRETLLRPGPSVIAIGDQDFN